MVALLACALTMRIIGDRSAGEVLGTAAASAVGVTLVLIVLRILGTGQGEAGADRS